MKYRKIFTFILLLCTIFSTLLFINPTLKAVSDTPPSDLTGYTVTVPANWTATAGYGRFILTFTVNDDGASVFYIGYSFDYDFVEFIPVANTI